VLLSASATSHEQTLSIKKSQNIVVDCFRTEPNHLVCSILAAALILPDKNPRHSETKLEAMDADIIWDGTHERHRLSHYSMVSHGRRGRSGGDHFVDLSCLNAKHRSNPHEWPVLFPAVRPIVCCLDISQTGRLFRLVYAGRFLPPTPLSEPHEISYDDMGCDDAVLPCASSARTNS
jgi:hypothetical protein